MTKPDEDGRWTCWWCGDIDWLDVNGLCPDCTPPPVRPATFAEVCGWAAMGIQPPPEPRWEAR